MFKPESNKSLIDAVISSGRRACIRRMVEENKLIVTSLQYLTMARKGWWDVLILLPTPRTRGIVGEIFEVALQDRYLPIIKELVDKTNVSQEHLNQSVISGDDELLTLLHPYVVNPHYPSLVSLAVKEKNVSMVHTIFNIIQRGSVPQAVFQWLLKNPSISLIMKEASKSAEVRRLLKAGRKQFPTHLQCILKDLNTDGLL